MNSRSYGRLISLVVGVLILAITVFTVFSRAQQEPASGGLDPSGVPSEPPTNDLFTNRIPHPACPHCFKVNDGRYGIYEEVPGTGILILREIPDPAPLLAGEIRPEFDEEGEPIWYVGDQGIVGPTDEEPVSADLSTPKIELRRIQSRHMTEIFSIRGVNGFGINGKGFVVTLDPKFLGNQSGIPPVLEEIPVEVEVANTPIFASHSGIYQTPVPVASGIQIDFGGGHISGGTLGPHIVRDETQPGIACCQIWSLTASHVVHDLNTPNPTPGTLAVYQPAPLTSGTLWGYVAHSWSALSCKTVADPNCTSPSAPINWTDQNPDVAAIAHVNLAHSENPTTFVATGREPIRRMQYGSSYVNGPSGLIRTPTCCSSTSVKRWGAYSNAGNAASVNKVDMAIVLSDESYQFLYKFCCVDRASLSWQKGDSGALIAYDGTGNRHVAGVLFAGDVDTQGQPIVGVWFTKSFDIQTAFINAGKGFHYYWGTAGDASQSGNWRPARTQCDPPGC